MKRTLSTSRSRKARKPNLANPGELWQWLSEYGPMFYVVEVLERTSRGQMYRSIDVNTMKTVDCFMSYDPFNNWKRIA